MFTAGELDQRVDIRREVLTPDAMGGGAHTFETLATVWAKIRPLSGGERREADRTASSANYAAVIRYRNDITEADIIVWNGERFNIRFIRDMARQRFLMLEIERGVAL